MTSPRKVKSALSLIAEEEPTSTAAKSCESLYSNNTASSRGSAAVLYRKAPTMVAGQRQASLIPATSDIRQRVLSARRLRIKNYQNQLADAQQTITDLTQENRILRTLHKRQDSALAKYESTNAELPQLLHSHAEELRIWQTKCRNLQGMNKELEQKLKHKDSVILSLTDQNKYYHQLNKDRSLEERQRLTEKLHKLENRLLEKDKEMKLISRKFLIETKSLKKQLEIEQKKYKDLIIRLEKTRLELSSYRKLDELSLIPDKLPNDAVRCKWSESKREKALESSLDESDYSAKGPLKDEHDNYVLNDRLIKDVANSNKRELRSSRIMNMKKVGPTLSMTAIPNNSVTPPAPEKHYERRIHRGDGDASALAEINLRQNKSKLIERAESTTVDKPVIEEIASDNDIEVYEEEEVTTNANLMVNGVDHNVNILELDNNDNNYDDDEPDEDNIDTEPDVSTNRTQNFTTPSGSSRIKEDISNIRKQITADFKEREAFLDTFCKQSTSPPTIEKPLKRVNKSVSIATNRKHKLLAALKAIDNNQGVE